MNLNELRIGNLIFFNKINNPRQVNHIDVEYLYFDIEGSKQSIYKCEMNKVQGIPITEDLLLKCGFEPIRQYTVMNSYTISLGHDRILSIGNIEDSNQMIWLESVDNTTITDLICVHNFDYDGEIYLHRLQNLYFALSGKELEIKL